MLNKNTSLNSAGQNSGFFDIIIGNPPYVQIKQIPWDERRLYETLYKSATGRFNLFYLFMEKSIELTKNNGISAYIVPDRIMLNTQCANLRQLLLNDQIILEIDSFDESIFESAVVDSVIILFKNKKEKYQFIKTRNKANISTIINIPYVNIPVDYFSNSPSNQFDIAYNVVYSSLIKKLQELSLPLGKIAEIKDGIIQGKVADLLFLDRKLDTKSKKLLFGEDIKRYKITFNNNWVNYKPDEMLKVEVKRRGIGIRTGLWMRTPEIFEREKILTRQTADEIIAAYDNENYYYSNTLHGTTIIDANYDIFYILGILNSKLMTWYYRSNTAEEGKTFAQIKIALLKLLPIRIANKNEQNKIISLVKKIHAIKEKNLSEDIIKLLNQIDVLVYCLYGLSYNEVKVIEPDFQLSKAEYEKIH